MAKKNLNLDNDSRIHDEISFTYNGKEYSCVNLTTEVLSDIAKIGDDPGLDIFDVLPRQLGMFTGTDPDEFKDIPFQVIAAAVEHINECLSDPLGKKKQRAAARR